MRYCLISVIFLFLFFINSASVYSSDKRIDERAFFGINEDSVVMPNFETIAIAKICSLNSVEGIFKFYHEPKVVGRCAFSEFPCIRLYYLNDGSLSSGLLENPQKRIIFNICDTTIYYYGGGEPAFSSVFRQYIPAILEEDKSLDFIEFYLNTISSRMSYHVLTDIGDYEQIWAAFEIDYYKTYTRMRDNDQDNMAGLSYATDSLVVNDINSVKDIIRGPCVVEDNGTMELEFMTWENLGGLIEKWNMEIDREGIYVKSKRTMIERVGPYRIPH